jgi:Fe-S-cluster-containing hydrogenase component 2
VSTTLTDVGYLSEEEYSKRLPSVERVTSGPVAVIECIQDIPCNPCEQACPFGAITVGEPITSLPALDAERCKGCGACIAKCPGLAIFVIDASGAGDSGTVQMPYEYQPLPKVGETVWGVSRKGERVAKAKVERVLLAKGADHTAVVTISVPKKYVNNIRSIRRCEGD